MNRLKDKVVIVTGGANGIGAAYCEGIAREGATTYVIDIDEQGAANRAKAITEAGGIAHALRCDVSDEQSVNAMVNAVVSQSGQVDGLINNAGILPRGDERIATVDLSVDEWDRMMAVNLRGMFMCSKAVIAPMRDHGGGSIINVSSSTWYIGSPTRIHYVTSKAGVVGFTRSLAREIGSLGIRVNGISPGGTLSEVNPSEAILKQRSGAANSRSIPRTQYPEDLVGTALYLLSDDSSFVTGQTIVVDGGVVFS